MPTEQQIAALPVSAASTKRKTAPRADEDDSGSESGSDVSMINVDFDFYNFNPDVDLIAVKRLLRQTLSADDSLIDVHPLAELILSEGVRYGAGSTIKTDGEESDPWGLVAVLDIDRHRETPAFAPFLQYITSQTPAHSPIQMLLAPSASPALSNRPALVFSLRTLNLPLPLIPPLYKMLLAELAESRAAAPQEVPDFTHWLVWGRGYRLEGSEEDMGLQMDAAPQGNKKKKNKNPNIKPAAALQAGSYPYHPEEEFLDRNATLVHTFPFKSAQERNEESFGVEQFGRLVLLDAPALGKAVGQMEEACRP